MDAPQARLQVQRAVWAKNGRGDRIRTCDPLLPKQMRYQAALLPDHRVKMLLRPAAGGKRRASSFRPPSKYHFDRNPGGPGGIRTPNLAVMRGRLYRRSEEHTSELQSLLRISYAVFCLKTTQQHTQ